MPSGNLNDDDYVVSLLKADAKNAAKKYELVGVDAFNPKRPRSGAPKPNTGFLRHIIRQTDSHNAALLAKEAEDSRARLNKLDRGNRPHQRSERESPIRYRSITPPLDERHRRKRRHRDSDEETKQEARRSKRTDKHSRDKEHDRERSTRRRESRNNDVDKGHGDSKRSRDHHHHRRERRHRRDYSSEEEHNRSRRKEHTERSRRRRRSRSRSNSPTRSSSPRTRSHRVSHRRRSRSRSPRRSAYPARKLDEELDLGKRNSARRSYSSASDSDPLEAIVGPLPPSEQPPLRTRGRGAHKAHSMGIDARFSSTYDPSNEMLLGPDTEDKFGDTVEAYRDRQKWKRMGGDRLREAGFTDAQIKKWENGDEKTEEDVIWAAKGEKREWDRNKILDDNGNTDLKVEFGRLK
ncbi:unnamed protein product [Periconia digitata]|uniref:Pre-mRNA-splicing factor 38B n=1 Tax=Periconia digitata TaxID=1303443 RepID=A0A9W4UIT0_9PLEO|nr:unnamed protein product [Periconia digitata]